MKMNHVAFGEKSGPGRKTASSRILRQEFEGVLEEKERQ